MVYSWEICRDLDIKNDLKGREIEEFGVWRKGYIGEKYGIIER